MIKIVFDIGSGGRAARQRSAKPRTAVRIRSAPQHHKGPAKAGFFVWSEAENPIFQLNGKRKSVDEVKHS